MWDKDTEGSITAAFLDISVTDCRCSLIKANIMEKKKILYLSICIVSHNFQGMSALGMLTLV